MSSKVDKELLWLAAFVCIPNWAEAARAATARTTALGFEMNLLRDGSLRDVSPRALLDIAHRLKGDHPTLSLAWRMLALRTSDDKALIHEVVGVVVSVVSSTDGDVTDALARLRVWDAVAAGKFTGDDFFKIAGQFWRGEREYIVARLDEENRAAAVSLSAWSCSIRVAGMTLSPGCRRKPRARPPNSASDRRRRTPTARSSAS
ncbi:hypothetical protein [Bradyrhizobium arachidis]|uniref:Uncharacterized protein n=1 Tax=Bradyrhizobium arachidis TaxID=858423 RepID=A0AAE7TF30_9BRAD|nr:hypothetical protein [Bradyrhizobium arachidis]QOZ66338.1 hypothetical protein WN72_07885 [Bradyrhizobium arachidis]SFV07173.1 hypothetical protein SAMN05192541_11324 [Bradyrhizobium arachidis]